MNKIFFSVIILSFIGLISCSEDKLELTLSTNSIRAIVVNEGQFGYGTGSLTSLDNDKIVTQDLFRTVNSRPLGDVPQSLTHIGNNYYIPVNNSRKVEVVDANTFESVETMVLDENVIPMYAVYLGGDEIIVSDQTSSTASKLMILDINHDNANRDIIKRVVTVPFPTFQMKIVEDKLFVAGVHLSVFDLDDIYEESRRTAHNMSGNSFGVSNFSKLCLDKNGLLWVLTDSGVACVDTRTEKVIKEVAISGVSMRWGSLDIDTRGENLYISSGNLVYTIDVDNSVTPTSPIITHDNNDKSWVTYTMAVSKENTIFMVRVLYGSLTRGRVFEYNLNGEIVNKYPDSYGVEQRYFRAGIFPHFVHFL